MQSEPVKKAIGKKRPGRSTSCCSKLDAASFVKKTEIKGNSFPEPFERVNQETKENGGEETENEAIQT